MNFGELDGVRVLDRSTVEEIRTNQAKGITSWVQGLIWYFHHHQGNHPYRLLGHNGGDKGVATQMFFRPDANVGAIVLTNSYAGSVPRWRQLSSVRDRLIHEMYT